MAIRTNDSPSTAENGIPKQSKLVSIVHTLLPFIWPLDISTAENVLSLTKNHRENAQNHV